MCGALVGSEAVLQGALGPAAAAGELSTDEAADALQLLSLRAGAQMQVYFLKNKFILYRINIFF